MSMDDDKARELVEQHLSQQDLRGYRYDFLKVSHNEKRPDEIGVVFNVYTPKGSLIDGPAVFIVHKSSGEVSVL